MFDLETSQHYSLSFKVDSASHSVDNRLRLLEYLLLHEGGEVALHDLLHLHLERGDLSYLIQLSNMISEVSDCQTNVNVDVDKTVLFDEIQFPIISSFSVRLAPPPHLPQTMTQ